MKRRPLPPTVSDTVDLSPVEFAELLDLTAIDAPYLATAAVRLPRAWVEDWKSRTGVRELTTRDLCLVLSAHENTIRRYLHQGSMPRLKCRVGVGSVRSGRKYVSPANVIAFLKARSAAAGVVPEIRETAGQAKRRALNDQARLAAICGESRICPAA